MNKPEVLWEITHKCNAKCIHCISGAGDTRNHELTTEEALYICDQLAECSKAIHLLGGEVFLRNDWKKIIERIHSHGMYYSIVTNGIALNREKIKYLKNTGLNNIGISIDAGTAEVNDYIRGVPGLYNKVFEVMDILAEEKMKFTVISTFNKLNIHQVDLMLGNMINSPAKVWQTQGAVAHGRMAKDLALNEFEFYILSLFLSTAKKKISENILYIAAGHDQGHFSKVIPHYTVHHEWEGCYAGKATFGICSNGDIQGCLCMMSAEDFVLGNVKEKPIKQIYNVENFCSWNHRNEKYKTLKGFCKDCEHGYQCLAGCSSIATALTGTVGENPQCHHRIETEWKDKQPTNEFEYLFKELTGGFVDDNGNVFLASGNMLTKSLISKLNLDAHQQKLLSYIANV